MQKRGQPFKVSITSLLPLLRDEAHSIATVKHVLEKIKETVQFLNPGQTPVVAAEYGEDKVVMMFGGLHIEMAALKSVGSLLKDSGWTSAPVEAGVASSGTAESHLSASNVTKTRQAHQITACYSCCLYRQRKAAYNRYGRDASQSPQDVLDFEEWCKKRRLESPQFAFWDLVLALELTILTLIRSFREADFCLYREALAELLPYFFANNNVNYARWLSIHLRDMMTIDQQHPKWQESSSKDILSCTNLANNSHQLQSTKPTNKTMQSSRMMEER